MRLLSTKIGSFFLYFYGETGVGKSHLLYALCQDFINIGKLPIYLSLRDRAQFTPEILQDINQCDLIAIDDIDAICGDLLWEELLLNCFNQTTAAGKKLVISSSMAPHLLTMQLPDLKSRLIGGGLVLPLYPLNDTAKVAALQLRAQFRGLELDTAVANFLIARHDRSITSLFALLDRLDRASLVAQRRLTIPFVKDVLQETNS
jgi:DnaA family protein